MPTRAPVHRYTVVGVTQHRPLPLFTAVIATTGCTHPKTTTPTLTFAWSAMILLTTMSSGMRFFIDSNTKLMNRPSSACAVLHAGPSHNAAPAGQQQPPSGHWLHHHHAADVPKSKVAMVSSEVRAEMSRGAALLSFCAVTSLSNTANHSLALSLRSRSPSADCGWLLG